MDPNGLRVSLALFKELEYFELCSLGVALDWVDAKVG